jgi:uncharacterized protein YjbI with pentapeptide repeats/DNA-binding XRE family transcriptional regulator
MESKESNVRERDIFSKLIKSLRSARNLTQQEFAQFFTPKVTAQAIGLWERGESFPTRKHWQTLADLSEMDLGQFYEYVGVGSTSDSNILDDVLLKIKSLSPEQLETVSQVLVDQSSRLGASSRRINQQHLKWLKKGVEAWNKWRHKNPDIIPQLAGLDLNQENCLDLNGFNLDYANLAEIEGSMISLDDASLIKANLTQAKLSHTSFNRANLREATLEGSELSEIHLDYANLYKVNLTGAEIQNSWLREANLEAADLQHTKITDTYFTKSRLVSVNLQGAILQFCDFTEVNFNEASLENVTMLDCTIYGISTWNTQTKGATFEKLHISYKGRDRFPIDDLVLAPIIYLHRQNQPYIQGFIRQVELESKVLELAIILVKRYGEYSQTEDFRIYRNIDVNAIGEPGGYYQVLQKENNLTVTYQPDYHQTQVFFDETQKNRDLLWIGEGVIESAVKQYDIDNLQKLCQWEEKRQSYRFHQLSELLKQIFKTQKANYLTDDNYHVEVIKDQVILTTNSELKFELMRAKINKDRWTRVSSSLTENVVNNFKQLQAERIRRY